jgi:hypothetical protein
MAYYRDPNYYSEADMKKQGFSEDAKAEQRVSNWYIRIGHYAKTNCVQFRKMVEHWAESFQFPSPGVPTMTMLHLLRLARENGICSDTLRDFARAEEDLLERIPGFVSPAAVPFNTEKKNELCLAALKARAERREKKMYAELSKTSGRAAAAQRRSSDKAAWNEAVKKGRAENEAKIATTRNKLEALGYQADPVALQRNADKLEFELMLDHYIQRIDRK